MSGTNENATVETAAEVETTTVKAADLSAPLTQEVIEVLPESLVIHPVIRGLRAWTGKSKQEGELQELADSLKSLGQKIPAVVWESEEGLVLVAGQRRMEAVKLLREEGDENRLLRVIIDPTIRSFDDALQFAIHENTKRSQFTAVEEAQHVQMLRETLGAKGAKGTQRIAALLGKDKATITQLDRVLQLPEDTRQALANGEILLTAALATLTTDKEKQPSVMERARQIRDERKKKKEQEAAAAEAAEKKAETENAPAAESAGKKDKKKSAEEPQAGEKSEETAAAPTATAPPKSEPITERDVRRAQREVAADSTKLTVPRIGDFLDLVGDWRAEQYPKPLDKFLVGLQDYAKAKLHPRELSARLDDVADLVHKGELRNREKAAAETRAARGTAAKKNETRADKLMQQQPQGKNEKAATASAAALTKKKAVVKKPVSAKKSTPTTKKKAAAKKRK